MTLYFSDRRVPRGFTLGPIFESPSHLYKGLSFHSNFDHTHAQLLAGLLEPGWLAELHSLWLQSDTAFGAHLPGEI